MSDLAAPEGVLVGAWSYVIAGYGLTALVILGYAWSLRRRRKASSNDSENNE